VSNFKAENAQNSIAAGAPPIPRCRSLQRSAGLLAGFKGLRFKGREGKGKEGRE